MEAYFLGGFFLPYINGPNEGVFVLGLLGPIAYFAGGSSFYAHKVYGDI